MKKLFMVFLSAALLLSVASCVKEPDGIKKTFEKTSDMSEEADIAGKTVRRVTYYELNDGTYKANDNVYKYKLTLKGTWPNSDKKAEYVVLSNNKNLTFDEVFLNASGMSSNLNDYLKPEEAIIAEYTIE